jgi:hypothetical protein
VAKRRKPEETDTVQRDNFDGMSMTEVSLHLDKSAGGQVREERIGVSKRGGHEESLFYLTTTDGDFYIFNNMIQAPPVSKIPFVSPLSYSGLMAYKFKTIKIDRTVKPKVYTIAIRPRQLSNATIEGEIRICEVIGQLPDGFFGEPIGRGNLRLAGGQEFDCLDQLIVAEDADRAEWR